MLQIMVGDALEKLRELPDESVHCCVTSPPYWGLRDYSTEGQLGLEKTPEEYVAKMVEVFREVRRVLRKDGTCWVNLGDSYNANQGAGFNAHEYTRPHLSGEGVGQKRIDKPNRNTTMKRPDWLKPKDLVGIPWMIAFALRADCWYLRQDIIWAKPNPMPESVTDRCTKAHEYMFLLTKSARYFYDAGAIKEEGTRYEWNTQKFKGGDLTRHHGSTNGKEVGDPTAGRNKRSVWTVATAPYPEAHFATYPPDLIKPCILAGTSAKGCCAKCGAPWERIVESSKSFESGSGKAGNMPNGKQDLRASETNSTPDIRLGPVISTKTIGWQPTCKCHDDIAGTLPCTVLDPFAGSGTTGKVALELGRKAILIELKPKYVELIKQRCNVTPGLALA